MTNLQYFQIFTNNKLTIFTGSGDRDAWAHLCTWSVALSQLHGPSCLEGSFFVLRLCLSIFFCFFAMPRFWKHLFNPLNVPFPPSDQNQFCIDKIFLLPIIVQCKSTRPLYFKVIQSKSVFTRVTDGQRCCYYSM